MEVNFRANENAVRLPSLKPVQAETVPVTPKKEMPAPVELWMDTLKLKETTKSYGGGMWKGIKDAVAAGSVLVGLDWLATSCVNISKGKNTITNMLFSPIATLGKGIAHEASATASVLRKDGMGIVKYLWTTTFGLIGKAVKSAYKSPNISKVAKVGLPILTTGIFAYRTFRSYQQANKEKANIDILYTGHTRG